MKSIVEEASSIAKAIENGWIRAGKPQEFTVRIFEEPEKNFIGFTKKPAKVGLFYNETLVAPAPKVKEGKRQQIRQTSPKNIYEKQQDLAKPQHEKKIVQHVKPQLAQQERQVSLKTTEESKQSKWTPELIEGSKQWLETMLRTMNQADIKFSTEAKQYFLTIRFAAPIVQDKRKEQFLFKNWSHLLMQALRHKFKRGLRGYKIIITRAA